MFNFVSLQFFNFLSKTLMYKIYPNEPNELYRVKNTFSDTTSDTRLYATSI